MIWPIVGTSHVSLRIVLLGLLGLFLTLLLPAFFFGVTSLSTEIAFDSWGPLLATRFRQAA